MNAKEFREHKALRDRVIEAESIARTAQRERDEALESAAEMRSDAYHQRRKKEAALKGYERARLYVVELKGQVAHLSRNVGEEARLRADALQELAQEREAQRVMAADMRRVQRELADLRAQELESAPLRRRLKAKSDEITTLQQQLREAQAGRVKGGLSFGYSTQEKTA